jgi:hypothetical protein
MGLNFPSAPVVGDLYPVPSLPGVPQYRWDGNAWMTGAISSTGAVRYDTAQALTAAQKAQGRANIDALKKNYVINGAMMISQENGTIAGLTNVYYPVDQFLLSLNNTGTQTIQQVAGVTPAGSPNRIRVTATVADAAVAVGDVCVIIQRFEGSRIADLKFGTAAAKTFTLQFGCKGPAGTYGVGFRNGAAVNRAYVAEFVIAAGEANTDIVKSVTVAGDTIGTWTTDNTFSMDVVWTLMCGTTYQQTAGSWQNTNNFGIPGQFNFMGTAGNVFELFDVGLYEGTVAPAFQVPDYASELALCQRYYSKSFSIGTVPANAVDAQNFNGVIYASVALVSQRLYLPSRMRTTPTILFYSPTSGTPVNGQWSYFSAGGYLAGSATNLNTATDISFSATMTITGGTFGQAVFMLGNWTANARL